MLLRRISRRDGLTLIELVVVVAIISLLASLLLVGLVRGRATARAIHCQNNMQQIGVSTQSYISIKSSLPTPPQGGSMLVHLLPFLEHGHLYDQLRAAPVPVSTNTQFEAPEVYLCPSDGERDSQSTSIKAANYVGNAGTGELRSGLDGVVGDPFQGVRVAAVTDGTSNTALFSECLTSANTDNRRKTFYTITMTSDFFDLQRQIRLHASSNISVPLSDLQGRGRPWFDGNLHYTNYHHAMLPNESSGLNGTSISSGLYSASSEHSNGVNLVRLDGSVVFVSDEIDEQVWWSMGSRNGGEVSSN